MKKIFEFNVDNTIDIITNSSSELFVLKGKTKEIVEEMIREVYPSFEDEYKLVTIEECDEDDLSTYINSVFLKYDSDDFAMCKKLNVRPNILYKNFGMYGIENYWIGEYSKEGREILLNNIPKNTYLLFSLDENPNWDMQERLMTIASRYHLG
jgi:hypothetical protein